MSKIITLRDANQGFSRCIRAVEAGEEFVITRKGRPVARLVPIGGKRVLTPEQEAARARALARMEKGWPLNAGPLNRDELYDSIIARKSYPAVHARYQSPCVQRRSCGRRPPRSRTSNRHRAVDADCWDNLAGRASYWDALLVASAAEAGCTFVLSEDMADGSMLSGVRIHNPFAVDGLTDLTRQLLDI